jgi:hypothetical protein
LWHYQPLINTTTITMAKQPFQPLVSIFNVSATAILTQSFCHHCEGIGWTLRRLAPVPKRSQGHKIHPPNPASPVDIIQNQHHLLTNTNKQARTIQLQTSFSFDSESQQYRNNIATKPSQQTSPMCKLRKEQTSDLSLNERHRSHLQ